MHEIGIVRQLLRKVTAFAEENGIKEIHEVVVDCGELSLVIPEYVQELYPPVVKGSILEKAKLTVNIVPGLAECEDCDEIFNVVEHKGFCPNWGHQWLRDDDHNLSKSEYIPRPGDVMFFSYNEAGDTEHVALVEYCAYNSEGDVIIHVIEGNNPSEVQRNRYRLSNSQILGFGLCDDLVDTTMRSGNAGDKVLMLQESLWRIGLLEERHLTGTFGGNTRQAVMDFQRTQMEDKAVTGIADRETQQALRFLLLETIYEDPETWLVDDE